MFDEMFQLMLMMLFMILAGAFLRKIGVVEENGKKVLTNLILYWMLPCNIVRAFCIETGEGFWASIAEVLLVAAFAQLISVIGNQFLFRKMKKGEQPVFKYASVCSNAGFIGCPLAEGVFGTTGLLYATVFLIPLRVMMWTAGVSYFSDGSNKKQLIKKVLVHPCMLAVYIGIALMLTQLPLPGAVEDTLKSFSSCCTPLTMLYIGMILVDVNYRELISFSQIYFAVIRLVLLPGIVLVACLLIHAPALIMGVCVLMTAMPAGSTTLILASKYGADEMAAAKCVVFTTVVSVITTPIWSYFLLSMMV